MRAFYNQKPNIIFLVVWKIILVAYLGFFPAKIYAQGESCNLDVLVETTPALTCGGEGSVSFQIIGGSGNETVQIMDSLSGEEFSDDLDDLSPGTYFYIVSDGNCQETGSFQIENPLSPDISLSASGQITCNNPTLNLSGQSSVNGLTYVWSTNDGVIQSGLNSASASVSAAGTYTLTVTDPSTGCSNSEIIVVSQILAPDLTIATPAVINCNNPSVNLIGNSSINGLIYVWTTPNGVISAGTNTATATVNAPGTYTLTVTNPTTGCTTTQHITITDQTEAPDISIQTPSLLGCNNPIVDLMANSATPGVTYAWTTQNGLIESGENEAIAQVSAAGTYTLTVTNPASGCTSSQSILVSGAADIPDLSLASSGTITCNNSTVTLSASSSVSGLNYSWTTNDGQITSGANTASAVVRSAGTYTLTVTNPQTGCINTKEIVVNDLKTTPEINITHPDPITCVNSTITLSGSSNTQGTIYSWTTLDGVIDSGADAASAVVSAAGTYTLMVTDPVSGCANTQEVIVIASTNSPNISIANTGQITCANPTVTLNGASLTEGATYSWTTTNGVINAGANTPSAVVSAAGTYTLTVTNPANGCFAKQSVVVTTSTSVPNLSVSVPDAITCTRPTVTITASSNTPGVSYAWTSIEGVIVSGANSASVQVSAAGTYTVTVTDAVNGCTNSLLVAVTENTSLPEISIATPQALNRSNVKAPQTQTLSNSLKIVILGSSTAAGSGAWPYSQSWAGLLQSSLQASVSSFQLNNLAVGGYSTYNVIASGNANYNITKALSLDPDIILVNLPSNNVAGSIPLETTISHYYQLKQAADNAGVLIYFTTTQPRNFVNAESTKRHQLQQETVRIRQEFGNLVIDIYDELTDFNNDLRIKSIYSIGDGIHLNNSGHSYIHSKVIEKIAALISPTPTQCCTFTEVNLLGSSTTPNATYSWTTLDGTIVSGASSSTAVVNAAGTYTLTVTDPANGCTNSLSVVVTEDTSLPEVSIATPQALSCTFTEVNLLGSSTNPNATYSWTTLDGTIVSGASSSTAVVNAAGTYTLTVTDPANGRTNSLSVVVTENTSLPEVSIATPQALSCTFTEVNLLGSSTNPNATYSWTTLDGTIVSGANSSTAVVNAAGTYTLTVTDPANGCTNSLSVVLTENTSLPEVNIATPQALSCTFTEVNLLGSSTNPNATYSWTTLDGTIVSGANSSTAVVNAAGTYTLTVTDPANGCTNSLSVVVTEDTSLPEVSIATPQALSCTFTEVNLLGSSTNPNATYSWTTLDGTIVSGASSSTAVVSAAGTYTLTVTDPANGCTNSLSVVVTEDTSLPEVSIATPQALSCTFTEVNLLGSSTNPNATYSWTTLDGTIVSGASSSTAVVSAAGTYTLTVTDPVNGCTASTFVTVTREGSSALAVTLLPFTSVLSVQSAFALSGGQPTGGTYSGPGVSNGSFNPSVAGVGTHTITYTYTNGTCVGSANQAITVTTPLNGIAVVSFTLINANTDVDMMTLANGSLVNLATLPANATFNIRANTSGGEESVRMILSGPVAKNQVESTPPYALFGDTNGNYAGQAFPVGNYSITATPYTLNAASGSAGSPLSLNFSVVQNVVTYNLNLSTSGNGTASANPASGSYTQGSQVIVTASPLIGNRFVNWTDLQGNLVSTANPYTFNINANLNLRANFEVIPQYVLTLTSNANGTAVASPSAPYFAGTNITVTAIPNAGYQFLNWTDNLGTVLSTLNPYTFAINSNVTARANFVIVPTYTLSLSTSGNGTAAASPTGPYQAGANVTVTASPSANYQFVNWTTTGGVVASTANPYTFAINSNQTLLANFIAVPTYTLTLTSGGNGTAAASPTGPYQAGANVTVTASPSANYQFVNWTTTGGVVASTANPYTFAINSNQTLQANFAPVGNGLSIASLTLMDAVTDQDLFVLQDGMQINLLSLLNNNLAVRANTNPSTVGSVKFALTGAKIHNQTESMAPYALFGDINNGTNYNGQAFGLGNYTLTITPYSAAGGTGTAGTPLTINFEMIDFDPGTITTIYRINAAGPLFTDSEQNNWQADATGVYYTASSTGSKTFAITNTTEDVLYQTYRFATAVGTNPGNPFSYNLPVSTSGPFTVKLHFMEPFYGAPGGVSGGAGSRVFNINIENGQAIQNNFDIYAEAGAAATALVKQFSNITVNDGVLNINFSSVVNNALVCAIEVSTGGASLEFAANPNTIQLETGTIGSIGNFISTSNNTDPTTAILNAKDVNTGNVPTWLRVNNLLLNNISYTTGSEITFEFNATGLAAGIYEADVTAFANGYSDATIHLTMTVIDPNGLRPYILGVFDGGTNEITEGETNIPLDVNISTTQIRFASNIPNELKGLDNSTVIPENIKLIKINDGSVVPANVNSTGGGDAITIVPSVLLEANTSYRYDITDNVRDLNGQAMIPFSITFTTGTSTNQIPTNLTGIQFTKVELPSTIDPTGLGYATLTIGPDGKLYAARIDGLIRRYTINADGTLSNPQDLTGLRAHRRGTNVANDNKILIGLTFDPSSTANNLIAWVTYSGHFVFNNGPDWDGNLAKLTGSNLQTVQDVVINLPRSLKDHLSNSIAFGADGALYFSQGANSAMGRADGTWGNREERLLSAALLRLNVNNLPANLPIDAKTEEGGSYNPYAPGSALTIYATGIRNAYDLVFHSNGEIYLPTNGSAAGGNAPTSNPTDPLYVAPHPSAPAYTGPTNIPAVTNITPSQNDWLFRVVQGGYYGHPNSQRAEYILNRGDIDVDNAAYNGIQADPNYRLSGVAYNFEKNKSPNGAIEYRSAVFAGKLRGMLLVVRYSQQDDIIVLEPGSGSNKNIIAATDGNILGLGGFNDPLDLIEDVNTGNIYVSEYGAAKITLLKPNDQGSAFISSNPDELIFDTVKGTTTAAQTVTITNDGASTLQISAASIVGAHFSLTSSHAFPISLSSGQSVNFSVVFNPSSTTVGDFSAQLRITNNSVNSPILNIGLYGLSLNGFEGSNEPPLQDVVNTLGYGINVGWTTLASNTNPALMGEEVLVQLFEKASSGNVGIIPVARYSPAETLPYGYYLNNNNNPIKTQVAVLSNAPGEHQALFPAILSGTTSFDPGTQPFGIYCQSNTFNRTNYTEDQLNTGGVARRVRTYPLKDRNGVLVQNSYLVCFEDASNGDYQDYMYVLSNVQPVGSTGDNDPGPNPNSLTNLTLINAGTDQDIQTLSNGAVINLASLGNPTLAIRANKASTTVESVRFVMTGPLNVTQTESLEPFAIFGDVNGNYNGQAFPAGTYTLTVTPYTLDGALGTAGTPISLTFTIQTSAARTATTVAQSADSGEQEIKEEEMPGLAEIIQAYPNPTEGFVTVVLSKVLKDFDYMLVDKSGRAILNGHMDKLSDSFKINITHLPSGSYFLKVEGANRYVILVKE